MYIGAYSLLVNTTIETKPRLDIELADYNVDNWKKEKEKLSRIIE